MKSFDKSNSFSCLKNYIINDPIIDYFNSKKHDYQCDDQSYYKEYILKESIDYKKKIFRTIQRLSNLKNVSCNHSVDSTIKSIQENDLLIIQGKLYDKTHDLIVNCDLIIKYELFIKIFPKISNLPFHLYFKKNDYLLINLSYSTIHFKIDLKDIYNDHLIFYKKCELYFFQRIFNQYTNYKSKCFILGKEYKFKNIFLDKKEFIGYVTIDNKIKNKVNEAIKWVNYLKKNEDQLKLYPYPSCNEMYPNMNYKESGWENEKLKLANKIKEITLVWNISYDQRCEFLNQNIKCWDDPQLLKVLKDTKNKNIQEEMIHINQQNDIFISPRKSISHLFKSILSHSDQDIFFDIESFLSFDEKQSLFNTTINKENKPTIAIIGCIHNNIYKDFTIQKYSVQSEKKCIQNFSKYLFHISQGKILKLYHWGHAEYNYFQYMKNNYPLISFPEIQLINVLDYFRTEPIIIQGIFNFGLKSIGSALYKHKFIKTTWNKNDNGLETMIRFKEICIHHNRLIPLKRYVEVKEIIEYNRIDCQVLYEIVDLLRNKYI